MVSWIILAVLILLIFLFFKTKHLQHRVYMILLIALVIFFYTTGARVIAENEVDVKTFEGVVSAGKLYVSWLGRVLINTRNLAGQAIGMDWAGNTTLK